MHRRTGPFPLGGGGGTTFFCPESLILARKSNMFGQCIFTAHGGGGGKENYSFEVIGYRKSQRGRVWEGVSPSYGGDIFDFGVITSGLGCIIKFK